MSLFGTWVYSQSTSEPPASLDDLLKSEIRVNMAVPTNPAFLALDETGSDLLRPSNPKEFTAAVSQFIQRGKVALPQNFGLEFSPVMILRNGNVLKDSAKGENWDPLRLSLATAAATNVPNPSQVERVGFGLHYTYEKKGSSFQGYKERLRKALQPYTDDFEIHADSLRKVYNQQMGITPQLLATVTNDSLAKIVAARNAWVDSVYTTLGDLTISKGSFDEVVKRVKTQYKREDWNDFRLDFALATVVWSPDTLARFGIDSTTVADSLATFQSFSLWGGVSFPMFGTNYLQGLVGGNFQRGRSGLDSSYQTIMTLNGRLYVGSNRVKGFVEGQYQNNQLTDRVCVLASAGVEFNIYDGIWLHFYLGLEDELGANRTRLVSNFNFNLALPERFKLN